jgi:hypothetical protein
LYKITFIQPYRSTPLVLPGAKVYHNKNLPTESYLRHHPNPQMRVGPSHEYIDSMMKQKVADSVIQRVVGPEASYQQPQQAAYQPQPAYQQQAVYQQAPYQQQQQPISNGPKVCISFFSFSFIFTFCD